MINTVKLIIDVINKIPPSLTQIALFVALVFLGLLGVRAENRFILLENRSTVLESGSIRVEEQRAAEVKAITELTEEVKQYRLAMVATNRSLQEALARTGR